MEKKFMPMKSQNIVTLNFKKLFHSKTTDIYLNSRFFIDFVFFQNKLRNKHEVFSKSLKADMLSSSNAGVFRNTKDAA